MPENIDFAFLSGLEGGCRTTAYVPAEDDSKSGVTVTTGFDIRPLAVRRFSGQGGPYTVCSP